MILDLKTFMSRFCLHSRTRLKLNTSSCRGSSHIWQAPALNWPSSLRKNSHSKPSHTSLACQVWYECTLRSFKQKLWKLCRVSRGQQQPSCNQWESSAVPRPLLDRTWAVTLTGSPGLVQPVSPTLYCVHMVVQPDYCSVYVNACQKWNELCEG